jgi:hypothetical protein
MTADLSQKLDEVYIQSLEINLIEYLSLYLKIDNREAMNIYYKSNLCQQIQDKVYDIQYLDYKHLAEDLIENELKISLK